MFDLKIFCLKSVVKKEENRFLSVEDFLCFTVQQNGRKIRFSSSIRWFFSCSEFETSTELFFFNSFPLISVSWNEKIFPLFSFRIKMFEWRKKCFVLFCFLWRCNVGLFNRFFWKRFCHWIVAENRCVESFVFCWNEVEQIFGIKREKLSLWDFPLSINSAPISIKSRRISHHSTQRHNRATKHRLVSSLIFHLTTTIVFSQTEFVEETNIFSFADLFLSIERTKMKSVNERRDFHLRFLICEQICQWVELSRTINSLREKITSMKRSLNRSTIFFITENRTDFSSKKIPLQMVRCSTWIKTGESQSVVRFYSVNKMEKFSSIVEENFSFVNLLKAQSEAEIEKKSSFSHCFQGEMQFDCARLRISSTSFNELIQVIH